MQVRVKVCYLVIRTIQLNAVAACLASPSSFTYMANFEALPVCVWLFHTRMGIPIRVWVSHTSIRIIWDSPYTYGTEQQHYALQ